MLFDNMLQHGLATLSFKHTVMGGHATLGVSGVTRAGATAVLCYVPSFFARRKGIANFLQKQTAAAALRKREIFFRETAQEEFLKRGELSNPPTPTPRLPKRTLRRCDFSI